MTKNQLIIGTSVNCAVSDLTKFLRQDIVMDKFNRFDFEQLLLECWRVTSDIKLLNEMHQDKPGQMSHDDVANYLLGLETIYEVKFQKLFDMFTNLISCKSNSNSSL